MLKILLTISILNGTAKIDWDIPQSGRYYLVSSNGGNMAKIESSNHPAGPCHVTKIVPLEANRVFWVVFQPD